MSRLIKVGAESLICFVRFTRSSMGMTCAFLLVVLVYFNAFCAKSATDLLVWFDSPAQAFTQSLPLGNGRLGAMVFGGVEQERIILNEGTLWSGSAQDADRPDAASFLPDIRRLLVQGKNVEA